jgi:two-component system response regulator AtoC
LIIDLLVLSLIQDVSARELAHMVLKEEGHRVVALRDYEEVCSILQTGIQPDLILIEPDKLNPDELSGFRQFVLQTEKSSLCLILGPAEQRIASDMRRLGVTLFLMKPVIRPDIESLVQYASAQSGGSHTTGNGSLRQIARTSSLARSEKKPGFPLIEELPDNRFFLAASPSMLEIYRQVKRLADVDVSVLILGESGTGKEIIAHLIHKYSRRSRQKFLNVNCAALPMDLLESELFGHVKGAFTGAITDKPGKFEQADGGTLLLDEIGEISAAMQAKLLHVLQDGQFTRLGGRQSTKVDVHILAATNIAMETALVERTFRVDLFYRLNTFTINVPPLRERREEIPFLVEEMIRRAPADMKPPGFRRFSPEVMAMLPLYDWPGNLRELRNFVIRTLVMQDENAAIRELEIKAARALGPKRQQNTLDAMRNPSGMRSIVHGVRDRTETQMIREALDASGWNRREAAQNLSISYRALLYKIQRYRLSRDGQRV